MKALFSNPWTTLVVGMLVAYVGISLYTGSWVPQKAV